MAIEIKVPPLPESVANATVAAWHKKAGDFVKQGENIVDLETDKVVLEVPAVQDGVLKEIKKPVGSTVVADEILGAIEPGAAAKSAAPTEKTAEKAKVESPAKAAPAQPTPPVKPAATIAAPPSVRRALAEQGLTALPTANVNAREEKRVPMSRIRQRIAERLLQVKQGTAMLTTFNEVNMKPVMDLRTRYKDNFEKTYKVRLGFMSFFTQATVAALKRFPLVNASIDGEDLVYHGYCDIGIAVSSERGLVVPVLRNAEQMTMADMEIAIRHFSDKARDGKLTIEDMQGGTFTITNGGVFGSMLSTPILNAPQSAILGMHNIVERPVVENGEIVIRPIMYVALSYDHRVIDGKESVSFLRTIKELLEDPARLLLDI